jgi:uncharacterized protein (DUF1810 family)
MVRYLTRRRSKVPAGTTPVVPPVVNNLNGGDASTTVFARTVNNEFASTTVFSNFFNGGSA